MRAYIPPGRMCRTKPPMVARMRPPMHMGANQALVRRGLAWRTSSMLRGGLSVVGLGEGIRGRDVLETGVEEEDAEDAVLEE